MFSCRSPTADKLEVDEIADEHDARGSALAAAGETSAMSNTAHDITPHSKSNPFCPRPHLLPRLLGGPWTSHAALPLNEIELYWEETMLRIIVRLRAEFMASESGWGRPPLEAANSRPNRW